MQRLLLIFLQKMFKPSSLNLLRSDSEVTVKFDHNLSSQLDVGVESSAEKAQIIQKNLRRTLGKCLKIPIQIELFCWLYGLFAMCSAIYTLVRVPFDLLLSMINVFLPVFGKQKYKHTALFACLIILGYYIVTQDFYFWDVSVLYHSFRGQSYVKLYGAGLALQICEKLFTMTGCYLFDKLNLILIQQRPSSFSLSLQMFICLVYCLFHFFSLYLDFILYTIILNSSSQNVMMFYFVVNLAKMKLSAFKKFQKKSFRNNLVYDAKDRFHKLTYSCIFLLTIAQLRSVQTLARIASITVFCATIDYLRHFTNLSMAGQLSYMEKVHHSMCHELYWGERCQVIKDQQKKAGTQSKSKTEKSIVGHDSQRIVKNEDYVVVKCAKWDFTIIPYLLFVLKFLSIIVRTNNRHMYVNELILYIYAVLCLLAFIVAPLLNKLVRRLNPKEERTDSFMEGVD